MPGKTPRKNPIETADTAAFHKFDETNVIRLYGLSDVECQVAFKLGQRLVQQKRADRVVRMVTPEGVRSVSVRGYWGGHFTLLRERGEVQLIGVFGRVLARDRRFEVVLGALRDHSRSAGVVAKR